MTIHRGHKEGLIIATTQCCQDKEGSSEITLPESSTAVVLTHSARRFSMSPPKTTFVIDGKDYEWKGYSDLFEKKTGRLVAQYSPAENSDSKFGSLVFTKGDQHRTDMIVASALVLQQRSEARKRAVCSITVHSANSIQGSVVN